MASYLVNMAALILHSFVSSMSHFFKSVATCQLLAAVTFANSVGTVTPQEEYYGKELIVADRDLVEQEADEILKDADVTDVAFLVVGDPFG